MTSIQNRNQLLVEQFRLVRGFAYLSDVATWLNISPQSLNSKMKSDRVDGFLIDSFTAADASLCYVQTYGLMKLVDNRLVLIRVPGWS